MSRLICYSLAVLPLLCLSQIPVITLHEPLESSIIVRRSTDQKISSLVRYDIDSEPALLEKLELCVQLEESVQKEVLPLSCFTAVQGSNSNNLDNLPLGNFVVTLVWRNISPPQELHEEGKITSSFSVRSIDEFLPKINFLSHDPAGEDNLPDIKRTEDGIEMVVTTESSKPTDVTVEYSLGESLLDLEGYDVCATLINRNSDIELPLTCMPNTQRSLTFQAMKVGSYQLQLSLGKSYPENENREMYQSSTVGLNIVIKNLNGEL